MAVRRLKSVAIESSEPFPLLALPHELIEEIATWFSQDEAVTVLTVNKTLHEAFARSLWRRVDIRGSLFYQPATTWQRYGPLVRIAVIGFGITRDDNADKATIWIPNVQNLTVYSAPVVKNLIAANQELLNLRRVQVFFPSFISSDPSVGMNVIDWIRRIEKQQQKQYGQTLAVNWDLRNLHSRHDTFLDHIVETIAVDDITSNSIALEVIHNNKSGPIKLDSIKAQLLTSLGISSMYNTLHFNSQYNHFLGSRSIEYPRLDSLSLNHEPREQNTSRRLVALNPAQLPALRCLKLGFGDLGAEVFERLLMHKFYTVKKLDLAYIQNVDVLERNIGYFPNVQFLVLRSCWTVMDLRVIVDSLPQLETLILININGLSFSEKSPSSSPPPSSSMLKELAISAYRTGKKLALTSEFWRFVAHKLPKLETLKLYDCEYREDAVAAHNTQPILTIRTLVAKMEEKQLVKLISILPKLHVLKVFDFSDEECTKWQEMYPRLKAVRSYDGMDTFKFFLHASDGTDSTVEPSRRTQLPVDMVGYVMTFFTYEERPRLGYSTLAKAGKNCELCNMLEMILKLMRTSPAILINSSAVWIHCAFLDRDLLVSEPSYAAVISRLMVLNLSVQHYSSAEDIQALLESLCHIASLTIEDVNDLRVLDAIVARIEQRDYMPNLEILYVKTGLDLVRTPAVTVRETVVVEQAVNENEIVVAAAAAAIEQQTITVTRRITVIGTMNRLRDLARPDLQLGVGFVMGACSCPTTHPHYQNFINNERQFLNEFSTKCIPRIIELKLTHYTPSVPGGYWPLSALFHAGKTRIAFHTNGLV
ncbi:hypothetical protein GQ42DRAFT_178843 [Ramicandelaber brevisporus]|nr:hypothetical protein GQ42DRAFT_178843 [Ramicandelaber brevisporus]